MLAGVAVSRLGDFVKCCASNGRVFSARCISKADDANEAVNFIFAKALCAKGRRDGY